ncbi:hypothetical protein OOZ15_18550 [Galbibacter sp. EGI 63066]|uniref:hypothetical protein n=1 Tax=Galbibacter sp. EGI 63066 TaxID=2993559 RepID=UPI00224982EA|nr:hypothetical protein [Galbibacter sp. EGI 63066]MCX2681958.1 hypothetical protein [Galbibacter sp. EGI 63066]
MPDASSQLDVVASDKGILIPRVALTSVSDTTTIMNGNVESLLIYNTTSSTDLLPRYYYWNTDKWLRIINSNDVHGVDDSPDNVVIYNPVL